MDWTKDAGRRFFCLPYGRWFVCLLVFHSAQIILFHLFSRLNMVKLSHWIHTSVWIRCINIMNYELTEASSHLSEIFCSIYLGFFFLFFQFFFVFMFLFMQFFPLFVFLLFFIVFFVFLFMPWSSSCFYVPVFFMLFFVSQTFVCPYSSLYYFPFPSKLFLFVSVSSML